MSQAELKPSSPTSSAVTPKPDVINKATTKLCHIVKRPDFDGYGFNLHSEKAKPGQFIGKVDANSPAEEAGLKEGDRIIEVNGVPINNETHKQVVQRIKAIACEVRLLLIDVEGKGDGGHHIAAAKGQQEQSNGQNKGISSKTEQVMPGASENINSITMVSTKRSSQEAQRSSTVNSSHSMNNNSMDVTDKAVSPQKDMKIMNSSSSSKNNNIISHVPPPPSATMASPNKSILMNHHNSNNNSSNGTSTTMETASNSGSAASGGNGNATIKAGSLQLPMTAAEMRAKLMMKKKYDPKNESVDLKKKYEIVQKL